MTITHHLDLSGLKCPLPVLRTRKLLGQIAAGEKLHVVSTDPLSAIDIPHMVQEGGHVLEQQRTDDGAFIFVICKNAQT